MKIAVAGLGYVGLSNAIILAQNNEVVAFDISTDKVNAVNSGHSPVVDTECSEYLAKGTLNLTATVDKEFAFQGADFVIVATPTDYDPVTSYFDTTSVESVVASVHAINSDAVIVIKSTVPVGFTAGLIEKTGIENILFSPEFLREGRALYDNLYPSRIIVGGQAEKAKVFASLLAEGALDTDINILLTNSSEAEAVKLFANSYLAMRVAFFNELDSFSMGHGLDSRPIIQGIGLDPRIGTHYNNPSFGYGGYCLPKDSKQLLANYMSVPQKLIRAIVESNSTRKDFIANSIAAKNPSVVGIHRLCMKASSDNFRQSSVLDVIDILQDKGINVLIYEPQLDGTVIVGSESVDDLSDFKSRSDLIVTNRMSKELSDVEHKVFSRDLFGMD